MAAEYVANAVQEVGLNTPVIFSASIPRTRGCVYHEDESGIFILRSQPADSCNYFAQYRVTFNGNIAIPTGGTVGPIAMALTVNGEPKLTSRAIYTPAAVDQYGNVTCTSIVKVPKGCCYSIAVESVSASNDPSVTPALSINVQNANLTISREA